MYAKHSAASVSYSFSKKISHLQGFISLENILPIICFLVEKIRIITKLSKMYPQRAMLPRPLVSVLGQFQVLLIVKLSKIGDHSKNFWKVFLFRNKQNR